MSKKEQVVATIPALAARAKPGEYTTLRCTDSKCKFRDGEAEPGDDAAMEIDADDRDFMGIDSEMVDADMQEVGNGSNPNQDIGPK